MQHVAIDLGSRESQICVRNEKGEIVEEKRVATLSLPKYLKKQPQSRVIVETSSEAFFIADAALERGHEVRVVPATLARALFVGERGIKTDQRDARKLSEVSTRVELPSVHVPSQQSRDRKSLCNSRKVLIEVRTKLINHVRGLLRAQAVVLARGVPSTLPSRVRDKLLATPDGVPSHVEWVLTSIEHLNTQIKTADQELKQIAEEDPICARLMSVPGVGPVIAVRFLAVIDQPERFRSAHDVMSYLGLTPGESSSSMRKQRTAITKAGASDLRFALVQGAWSVIRTRRTDPMGLWALQIAQRRNRKIAAVALARKLAGILFAICRDGSLYDPSRGATPVSPQG